MDKKEFDIDAVKLMAAIAEEITRQCPGVTADPHIMNACVEGAKLVVRGCNGERVKAVFPPEDPAENPFFGTSVEVRNAKEYGIALAAYSLAGANVWPWHKGYQERDAEECSHHLYGWNRAGFMKHISSTESLPGTYSNAVELLLAVKKCIEGQ